MSNPVLTDKWAGSFDCSVCRRKRLVAAEFSKTSIDKHRKFGAILKCKDCVNKAQSKERILAEARRIPDVEIGKNNEKSSSPSLKKTKCSSCKLELPVELFNRNQLAKNDKARCIKCVEKSIEEEASNISKTQNNKLVLAKEELRKAELQGNTLLITKAASKLAALEAEQVTGLKPRVLGRGRHSRNGGRGRTKLS